MLQNFGIKLGTETTMDVNTDEGKALAEKYGITKVPAIIMGSSAKDYPTIDQVWSQVGTVADDGSYILSKIELLGLVYKDLATGEIMGKSEDATATSETSDASAEESTATPENTTTATSSESAVIIESGS